MSSLTAGATFAVPLTIEDVFNLSQLSAPIVGASCVLDVNEPQRPPVNVAVASSSAFRAVACEFVAVVDDASFACYVNEPQRPPVNKAVASSSAYRAVGCACVAAIDIAPRINNVLHPQWLTMDTAMARGFTENAKFGLFITPNLNAKPRHSARIQLATKFPIPKRRHAIFTHDSTRTNQF